MVEHECVTLPLRTYQITEVHHETEHARSYITTILARSEPHCELTHATRVRRIARDVAPRNISVFSDGITGGIEMKGSEATVRLIPCQINPEFREDGWFVLQGESGMWKAVSYDEVLKLVNGS